MHDNPSTDSSSSANVKRYSPPNQRNKLNTRKSGDRLDRASGLHGNDGEKSSSAPSNDNHRSRVIPLVGCANSEVSQFLNDRWQSTMHRLHNTADPSVLLAGISNSFGFGGHNSVVVFAPFKP